MDGCDLSDIMNAHGVMPGDVFWLSYHGINVFLRVTKTDMLKACVYEMATERKASPDGSFREWILPGSKGQKDPLVAEEPNTWTRSWNWLDTEPGPSLSVEVRSGDRLYERARALGEDMPETGIIPAKRLDEEMREGISNFYWESEEPPERETISFA